MRISATVRNAPGCHEATVRTNEAEQSLPIAAKAGGRGSAVNGGELLMLALATCYCNDLYREAGRLGIAIEGVEVEARATFAGVGLAATDISYRVDVQSPAAPDDIAALVRHTDTVAEIHNTLRSGAAVTLVERSAES